MLKKRKISPQKGADQQIWPAPSIYGRYSTAASIKSDTPVSGGAYQDAREVTIVWNARLKHWALPKFRGRLHPASPRTFFSPIFSLAREKIGAGGASKRPRRNESLQARLLILCARFFLPNRKLNLRFGFFLCKSATTSQARSLCHYWYASSPERGALGGSSFKLSAFQHRLFVAAVVFFVGLMPLDPVVVHLVLPGQTQQRVPQVGVEGRFFVGLDPAPCVSSPRPSPSPARQ